MKHGDGVLNRSFVEAYKCLDEAIGMEGVNDRIAIHPYMTMFHGIASFVDLGGKLDADILDGVRKHLNAAEALFSYDRRFLGLVADVRGKI